MKRLSFLFLFFLFLIGCNSNENNSEEEKTTSWQHLTGEAQGTTFSIKYEGEEEYSKEIKQIFIDIDMQLSIYVDTSTISYLNRPITCTQHTFHVSKKYFLDVFNKSKEIFYLTNGSFNPAVYPLVYYWGFGVKAITPEEISDQVIDTLLQDIDFRDFFVMPPIDLNDSNAYYVVSHPRDLKIDFNAIAQGYTVDVIAKFLENKGIKNYMIEIGGEVIAKGKNDRGTYWKLGIDKPTDINAEHQLQAIIELKDRALATSGNYRKFYEKDGVRYSHTIDPKTGYPVQHSLLSATVLASDCASADAYATAFMVMGVEKTKEFLKNHPELKLDVYLIYSEKKNFKSWYSTGLKDLIDEDI